MRTDDNAPTIPGLTTDIVVAYLGHHAIATADVGRLITTVVQELAGLGQEPEEPSKAEPAVPVRRSVQRDHLVCLVCGKSFKSLRRHLRTSHDLTPESYRAMFELARDYPMVAAASSEQRAAIARRSGLGQRRPTGQAAEPAAVFEPEVQPEPQPTPSRKRKTRAKAAATEATPQPGLKPVRGPRAAKKVEATATTDPALQPQPEPERDPERRPRRKAETEPS